MTWWHILLALRTLANLFQWRGPPLALFWLATLAGLQAPSPLAAALGLTLVLRMAGNIASMRRSGAEIPGATWVAIAATPFLPLLPGDTALTVLWSAATAGFAVALWRSPAMRAQEKTVRPPPIAEADLWIDVRAGTLLATGALGLLLSLTGDPALWITGVTLGAAALDLTGLVYLRARGHV